VLFNSWKLVLLFGIFVLFSKLSRFCQNNNLQILSPFLVRKHMNYLAVRIEVKLSVMTRVFSLVLLVQRSSAALSYQLRVHPVISGDKLGLLEDSTKKSFVCFL
jgi:uncharacterized membrane protein